MPWIHRERMQSSVKDPQVSTHGPQNHGPSGDMITTLFDVVSGSVFTSHEQYAAQYGRSPFASGSNHDAFVQTNTQSDNYVTASVLTI